MELLDSFIPPKSIAWKCSHWVTRITLCARIYLPSTTNVISEHVSLLTNFFILAAKFTLASTAIALSSSLTTSRIYTSLSHLFPSNPPKIYNYLLLTAHAECLCLPAGGLSVSKGCYHVIDSTLRINKSLLLPRPS